MDSIDAAFNIFVYCKINREIDILKYGLEMAYTCKYIEIGAYKYITLYIVGNHLEYIAANTRRNLYHNMQEEK